jgi:hypothetical protein
MLNSPPFSPRSGLVSRALQIRAEVEQFSRRFAPLSRRTPALSFTWEELERQLVDLSPSDLQAELVHRLIERGRQFADLKPSELVLREILCIAALVLEEGGLEATATAA